MKRLLFKIITGCFVFVLLTSSGCEKEYYHYYNILNQSNQTIVLFNLAIDSIYFDTIKISANECKTVYTSEIFGSLVGDAGPCGSPNLKDTIYTENPSGFIPFCTLNELIWKLEEFEKNEFQICSVLVDNSSQTIN